MSRDLLLTVSIGEDEAATHTIERMRRYADAHGADFRVMDQCNTYRRPVFAYWEAILELCDSDYDRIAILDSDILVRRGAPSLFEVPFADIAMKPSGWVSPRFLRRIHEKIADDFVVADMYNSGVILASRDYLRRIADSIRSLGRDVEQTRFADQVYFCVMVKRTGVTPTPLSWRWNQHDQVPNFRAELAHFLHFRGPEKLPRVERFLQRNQNGQWGIDPVGAG
ncbi:hypothetical protein [Stieleria mannarensis]|uniref:hypothetical protein n=1 Tax=Stieleria mannarensis TaxID=2755585 RepID=UPI001600DBD6|nr:hypothetical protein [Rhodopirellula sp. JC639]